MKDSHTMEEAATVKTSAQTRTKVKLVLWGLLVVGLLVLAKALNAQTLLRSALDWIQSLGPWGPMTFALLYILATVLFLPGSILTPGAGVVFGVLKGSILVSISSTLGATAAFFVGRYLARGWVSKQIEGNATFKAIDEAVAHEGWESVGLTPPSPLF